MERLEGQEDSPQENVAKKEEATPGKDNEEETKDESKVLFSLKDFFERSKQIEEKEQTEAQESDSSSESDQESDASSSDKGESDLEVLKTEDPPKKPNSEDLSKCPPKENDSKESDLDNELNKVDNILGKLKSKLESDSNVMTDRDIDELRQKPAEEIPVEIVDSKKSSPSKDSPKVDESENTTDKGENKEEKMKTTNKNEIITDQGKIKLPPTVTISDEPENVPTTTKINADSTAQPSVNSDPLFERKFKLSGLTIKKSTDSTSSSINIDEILKQQKDAAPKPNSGKTEIPKKPFLPEAFKNISISKVGGGSFEKSFPGLSIGSKVSIKRGDTDDLGKDPKKSRSESTPVTLEEEEDSEYEEEEGARINQAFKFENCSHGSPCSYICLECSIGRLQAEWNFVQPRKRKVKPVVVKEKVEEPKTTEDPVAIMNQVNWQQVFKFAGVPVVEEVLLE